MNIDEQNRIDMINALRKDYGREPTDHEIDKALSSFVGGNTIYTPFILLVVFIGLKIGFSIPLISWESFTLMLSIAYFYKGYGLVKIGLNPLPALLLGTLACIVTYWLAT